MGTLWIARRADLTSVYAMIFRRLHALGADWVYHFPDVGIVQLAPMDAPSKADTPDPTSETAGADFRQQHRRAGAERLRAELGEVNASAREAALDRLPPATVRAYRQVFGRDPRGWPPA